jgi:hypothetical protein
MKYPFRLPASRLLIKKHTYLFFVALCFSSCWNSSFNNVTEIVAKGETSGTKIVDIPAGLGSQPFDYNKVLADIRYVKLETNDNCLVGHIDKILSIKNGYVIADYYLSNSVFFFDKTGKFIAKVKVSESSNSPGEIKDITYNYKTRTVYLYDNKKSTIYSYDENGTYLKKNKMGKLYFSRLINIGDSSFIFYSPSLRSSGGLNNSELAFGDITGKVKYRAFDRRHQLMRDFDYNYTLAPSKDGAFYSQKFSKYIYEISANPINIFPRFKLNFAGNNSLIDKVSASTSSQDLKMLLTSDNYNFDGEVLSCDDILYIGIKQKAMDVGVFYSPKSNKIIGGYPSSILSVGDTSKIEYYKYPIASSGEEFISVLDPEYIVKNEHIFDSLRKVINTPAPIRDKVFNSIIESMNPNENPVLVLYKVKAF